MADTVKVADLLPRRIGALGRSARQALANDAKAVGQQIAWGYVTSRLDAALHEALDCDLFAVFANGWAQSPLLKSYAAAMTKPSAEVQLGAHALTVNFYPTIAISIGPCPSTDLEFTLAVAAQFSGLKLEIANRHITGGVPGAVSASAELSFQSVTLHQSQSREVELPGRFRFSDRGIRIAPAN
jgi:hypothetical protein